MAAARVPSDKSSGDPATTDGGPEGLSPSLVPRRREWLCLYPLPILTRSRSPEHTHLHSRSAGCCAAGCRCSHFLFLPPAGQRHILHLQGIPRSAANSPPQRTLRSGRRRPPAPAPGHACLARSPPAGALVSLPTALCRGQWGCPRLFEVPLLKKEENVKHRARLRTAINNMCTEHDFLDELTRGDLQALINSSTLIAPPPGGRECVASFYKLSFLAAGLEF